MSAWGGGSLPLRSKKNKPRRRKFTAKEYKSVIDRQNGICDCGCGEPLGDDPRDIEFDHELELALGGADTLDNLRAKKKKHHRAKTSRNAAKIAKAIRIEARGGHRRRNMNAADRQLAQLLEKSE